MSHPLRAHRFGTALALLGGLGLCTVARAETITYGPMLTRGATPDRMIVTWGTQGKSDPGQVAFRKKGDTAFTMATGGSARDHQVVLTGLATGSEYEYSVKSGSAASATFSFHTCPAAGLPMDFVFYGDSRSDPTSHARVVAQVTKHNPEMVFESGDLVPLGLYAQYLSEFFPVVKDLVAVTPFQAAPGNHDASLLESDYGSIFPAVDATPLGTNWRPYYSLICGNAMFIGLNSNDITDTDQQNYLAARLHDASYDATIQHVLVWFHHSAYSPGSHGDNGTVQSRWVPLFSNPLNKVTAVFSGHDHLYARMKDSKSDVLYVVSGGAGADLYSDTGKSAATKVISKKAYNFVTLHVAGDTLSAVAYDDTDTEIDRFSVTKPHIDPPDMAGVPQDLGGANAPDMAMATDLGSNPPPPPDKGGCAIGSSAAQANGFGPLAGLSLLALAFARSRRRRVSFQKSC